MSSDTMDAERDGYMAGFAKARDLASEEMRKLLCQPYKTGAYAVVSFDKVVCASVEIASIAPEEHYAKWDNSGCTWEGPNAG